MRRPHRVRALLCALGLAPFGATLANADTLHTEASARDGDFVAVEELAYEVIIDAADPGQSQSRRVALRVTLHNDSDVPQDALLALALPRTSVLRGLAVKRGAGDWEDGLVTRNRATTGRRDAGSIYARSLPPARDGGLPAAEVAAFGLAAGSTTQVELRLDVFPQLEGKRWSIDLPRRNIRAPNLAQDRRVVMRGLKKGESFFVDGSSSGEAKYMSTRAGDTVAVSWPAHLGGKRSIEGQFEVSPSPHHSDASSAAKSGRFRLALRLGPERAPRPDHVVFVVDSSRSTSLHMARASSRVFAGVLDTLGKDATFELLSFDREASALMPGTPRADDVQARQRMTRSLDQLARGQGSNLDAALTLAGERLAKRGAQRPLILVVTDGSLPISASPADTAQALERARGKSKAPELLFLVDDPLVSRAGLQPESPVARVAAELGARIRVDSLSSIERDQIETLLASPPVLTELELDLPRGSVLDEAAPEGLVAGHVTILEGSWKGRAPTQLRVRGRMGKRKASEEIKAESIAAAPEALVAPGAFASPELAIADGFARPSWHNPSLARETDLSIAQVGYDTGPRRGHIDHEIVRRYMHMRVFPRASSCYNRELARNQVLDGRVLFEVELGKGEVMRAGIAQQKFNYGVSKDFVDCLTEAVWSLEVPAGHMDDEVYLVRYPLRFTPPTGGKAPSASDDPDPMFEMLMQRADTLSGKKADASKDADAPATGEPAN